VRAHSIFNIFEVDLSHLNKHCRVSYRMKKSDRTYPDWLDLTLEDVWHGVALCLQKTFQLLPLLALFRL